MKKILFFSALALIFASCSSDDNSSTSPEDNSTLPKTISYIYPNIQLGTNKKSTLTFNGNKIISSITPVSKTVYTYSGDLITKQEVFDIDQQGKETKDKEVVYAYENGKLKTRIFKEDITTEYPDGQYIEKTVYTHSTNELISYINYSVDKNTKVETKSREGNLTYKDGNLIKEVRKVNSVTTTRVYDYDIKNNPLKNITGFNLLLNEISDQGKNNIVKTTRTSSENSNTAVYLTTYTYNESNYPLKHTSFDGGGTAIEYEIEYTY